MFSLFSKKKSIVGSGLSRLMTDRHSHILPGVDDGVRTMDESLAILDWLEGVGLSELWLTPHIMEDLPNTAAELQSRFEELKSAYKGGVVLHLAAEYMIDNLFESRLEANDLLRMEDNIVLMETSTWSSPYGLYEILDRTMRAGYRPLLAHPERYRYMEYSDYVKLVDKGVYLQMNLPSIVGAYGEKEMKKAKKLLSDGMYSAVGSDCHNFTVLQKIYSSDSLSLSEIDCIKNIKESGR